MSWNSAHPRTWALEKYTNIISKESSMEPDLHAYLYQNLRELVIAKGKGVLERISLSTPHLSAIYRETSVLFAFPGQSQGMRFRIRFKGILDRQSFCLAVSEFVADVRESPASLSRPAGAPIQPPYSHSPLTTPIKVSPSATLNLTQPATLRQSQYSFSPLTPPQKAPSREVETQTEQFNALPTDPEELRIALKKVMQDESFHRTVKIILEILPSLDGALDHTH
ncbi:unnamed protein product [Nippostrongylus brasiliensis]|uniref:DUF3699 domain-containing protein n=1 Tax=Nippostrongylus brasiliensis TaxID=27835 RepID=A0A158R0V1_NIPBR|nr:unnamed protein product [Nippostrongylus brasiliensis]